MRKILITARDLNIGGIEKALISLIDYLLDKNYKITLILEEEEGEFFKQINKKVNIEKYKPNESEIKIIRKIVNLSKRIKFLIKYRNKFDVSISFATYLKSGSFLARNASKNSILWCHADYLSLFNGNKEEVKKFFKELYFEDFKKIVFVSQKAQETFLEVFPNKRNTYYCNNLADYKKIYELTEKDIKIKYNNDVTTFLNVGRHDEKQKRLSRIIKASVKLKKENYKFRVIFVGTGEDEEKYKQLVEKYNLQKNIIFIGAKRNPYPYYKIANCVVVSSDYEGYPVVFLESYILNKPIITTNVSDYKEVQNGRGIVVQKNAESIYKAMKKMIESGYIIKNKFNPRVYNENVKKQLEQILK